MSKSLSRLFYLFGMLALLVGGLLLARGYAGGALLPGGAFLPRSVLHPATGITMLIGLLVLALAGLSCLTSWIGALIHTAQLHRWGWFIALLAFSGITLTLYVFAGPTTPPLMPMAFSPYAGYGD